MGWSWKRAKQRAVPPWRRLNSYKWTFSVILPPPCRKPYQFWSLGYKRWCCASSFLLPKPLMNSSIARSLVQRWQRKGKSCCSEEAARVSKHSPPLSAGRSAKNSSLSPRELMCFHVHHWFLGFRVPGLGWRRELRRDGVLLKRGCSEKKTCSH